MHIAHALIGALLAATAAADDESTARTFVHDYQGVLWAAAILVGVIHCFMGYKVLRVTAFTSGFVMGGGGAFYAAKAIFAHASSVEYIAFVSLLVVGILAGVGVVLLLDVGIFLIGALLGVCLALLINTAVLYRIAPHHHNLALYVAMGVLGIVCGLLAVKARRITVILATAFAGAYAAAYGAGHFAGKFPNPFSVQDALHEGSVPDAWWAYFAGVLVFACAGTIVQLCTTREPGEEEHDVAPHREADHREARADPERGSQRYERLYEENAPRRGTGRPLQYMGRRHGDTRSWGASGRRDGRPAAVM